MASCTMIETRHCNHSQGRVKSRVACTSPGNTGALEHVHKHDDDGSRKQGTKIRRNAGRLDSPLIGSPGRKPGGNSADDGQGTAVQGVELADVDGGDADDTDEQGTKGANEPEWLPQAVSVLRTIDAWRRVRSGVTTIVITVSFIVCQCRVSPPLTLKATRMKMQVTPMMYSCQRSWFMFCPYCARYVCSCVLEPIVILNPKMYFAWPRPMVMAAPDMKPPMTEWERNFMSQPMRRAPMPVYMQATMKAIWMA